MSNIQSKNIKIVAIDKIVPNPKNPNAHPPEQIERLAKIIDYQGFRNPLVVSKRTGFLVVGHGRLEAAKKLGLKELPVMEQDFESEAQEYAYLVSDNAIADWAQLDLSGINQNIIDQDFDLDIDLLGIKDFELIEAEKYDEDKQDEVPDVTHDPVTKLGDVWILGEHRVMCGDSTMIDEVDRLMNGEKADMVFTDPPYNVASDSKNFAADESKAMNDLKNAEWDKNFNITNFLGLLPIVTKDSCSYYIWTSHFLINEIWEFAKTSMDFSSYLVWSKPNPMPSLSKRHPTWNTELCAYFTRGSKRDVNFPNGSHFLSCREVKKKSDGSHPTQKPLELIEPIVLFSSNPNKTIYDGFLGSGSTLIACEKTNRKCYGMELDPHYCDVICHRWSQFTGKNPILESTGEKFSEIVNKKTVN